MEKFICFLIGFIISYGFCSFMFWYGKVTKKMELRMKLEELNMNKEITEKEYDIIDEFLEKNNRL